MWVNRENMIFPLIFYAADGKAVVCVAEAAEHFVSVVVDTVIADNTVDFNEIR